MLKALRKLVNGNDDAEPQPLFADPSGALMSTPPPTSCAAADIHVPAANTAAVVTYAAVPGKKHVISGVAWSYGVADPAAGNLKIEDGAGTVVFSMDITAKGAGYILFPRPKRSAAVNTAMIVTLSAGGGTSVAKLSVLNHWTE